MMRPVLVRTIVAATITLALAACAGDGATSPAGAVSDADLSADVAAQTGDAVVADLASFGEGELLGGLSASVAGTPTSLATIACQFAAGRFRCPGASTNNVTTTHSYAYLDAAGAAMTSYDARLTASLNLQTTASGSSAGTTRDGNFTNAFSRTRDRTVSGLLGAETQRTWNGTGSGTDAAAVTGSHATRHYTVSASDTTRSVVVNLPRSANAYPASGTHVRTVSATVSVDGARTATRSFTRRAVVTFNGTAAVPLVVGTLHCTLHLDSRTVDGCAQ